MYFEVTEALTNAVKHGRGPIAIELNEDAGALKFAVTDQGPGFDVSLVNGGSGLQNLRDRIDAVRGRLGIVSVPGQGTTVRGEVPV